LRIIAGLPLTNTNYNHSVQLLRERYGEQHKLVDAHMQALIVSPSNTLSSLQLFYDSGEGHILSLKSLGTPQEQYGSMLVPTILRKFSPDTRRNIARSHGNDRWTLSELQSAILQELRIPEMGTDYFTSNQSQKDTYTPTASFFTNADRQQAISKQPKRHSEQLKRHSCVYCGEAHRHWCRGQLPNSKIVCT